MTNRGPNRTLEDALRNAERLRREIPLLVQPEDTAYDMVTLADEIYRLRGPVTTPVQRRNREICDTYDAFYDPATGEWLEGRCGDPACEYCEDRPDRHPENCCLHRK